jgi:putative transposase
MVDHPSEYPWSSYRFNGVGQANDVVRPHELYLRLGSTVEERCHCYRKLFNAQVDEMTLDKIREATNKSWVLGDNYFKEKILENINRQIEPIRRGGDRRSKRFKKK